MNTKYLLVGLVVLVVAAAAISRATESFQDLAEAAKVVNSRASFGTIGIITGAVVGGLLLIFVVFAAVSYNRRWNLLKED